MSIESRVVQFQSYQIPKTLTIDITRAAFDAHATYTISQQLESAGFDLEIKVEPEAVSAVVTNRSGPVSIEVASVAVARLPDASAIDTVIVQIAAIGLYDGFIESNTTSTDHGARIDKVRITGHAISLGSPDVT